jgi:cytochrome c oxidase subunit II
MGNLPFFPVQASTLAPQVDLIFLSLIGLSSFFSLVVIFFIVYFGVRYRRGKLVDRSNPPTTSMKMELSWVFGLLVLGMGAFGSAAIVYFNQSRPPDNSLEIYAVGKMWMWQFQHPDGPREIDELHVPLGQPVRLIMTSQDVIHSLYIPAFRTKYDVIPGRYTSLWFEATQPGVYHLFCTEFCGTNHSRMRGQVVVLEPREYQRWLAENQTGASLPEHGQELFAQLGCDSCHAPDAGTRAPELAERFGKSVSLASGGTVPFDENYIMESILQPQAKVIAGYDPIMPTYQGQITEVELAQIVSYIKSMSEPIVVAGTIEIIGADTGVQERGQ